MLYWTSTARVGETSIPRHTNIYQLDLFASPYTMEIPQTPLWHALPLEARQALTQLMVRLILDHADNRRVPEREEMRCDVWDPHQALGNRPPMAVWRAGVTGELGGVAVDMWTTLTRCPHIHSHYNGRLFVQHELRRSERRHVQLRSRTRWSS